MTTNQFSKRKAEAAEFYHLPLYELLFQAHSIHRKNHDPADIMKCSLLSIKTGGCSEDCGYCPQSAHHETGLEREPLMNVESVRSAAVQAKAGGAQRFCMGAAWRSAKTGVEFQRVLEMIKSVKELGLETCVTLGMVNPEQARQLKGVGLDAYNHNLDSSREFYSKIIHTRTFDDRLTSLEAIYAAKLKVCCGGIIGMGETVADRCALLAELSLFDPAPESVPINVLEPVKGTPLQDAAPLDPLDLVRTVAVARILMPKARVRLAAGRSGLSRETQILAFFAGANSIFLGEKLLTRANSSPSEDQLLLEAYTKSGGKG